MEPGAEIDAYAYPALLEAIFARTSRNPSGKVEVVNAGVFGYHSLHSALRVSGELAALAPDAYVVMDGLNDLVAASTLSPQDIAALGSGGNMLTRLAPGKGLAGRLDKLLSNLRTYRFLASLLASRPASGHRGQPAPDLAGRLDALGFRHILEAMAEAASRQGAALALVAYPWKVNPKAGEAGTTGLGLNPDHLALYLFGREAVSEVVRRVAADKQALYVAPQPLFDDHAYSRQSLALLWSDDIHFTRRGNLIIAKSVYASLMALPAVRQATGRDAPASDAEIDALFPEVLAWFPPGGMGWPATGQALGEVASCRNCRLSKPNDKGLVFASPADSGSPAELLVDKLPMGVADLRVYPRIQSPADKVEVLLEGDAASGRAEQSLFSLTKAVADGVWTPESAWYPLAVPAGSSGAVRLRIRLNGENAQLWGMDGKVFFRLPEPARPN